MLRLAIDELSVSFTVNNDFELERLETWHIICENFMNRLMKKIGVIDKSVLSNTNLPGYDITYNFGLDNPIKFAFHSVDVRSGMTLKFNAISLGKYLENNNIKIYELLNKLKEQADERCLNMRVRRIDIVADYIDEQIPEVDELYKGLREGTISILDINENVNRSSINSYENDFVANTIYVGQKKTAERFLRIYDKKVEQLSIGGIHYDKAKDFNQWIRFESSFKKELATQIGNMIIDLKTDEELISFMASQITNKYCFYENRKRMFMTNKLLNMVVNPVSAPVLSYNKDGSMEKLKDYFRVGDSGLQGLLYQIRVLEGEKAMNGYISEIVNYQMNEYKPSENIKEKIKKYQKKDEE